MKSRKKQKKNDSDISIPNVKDNLIINDNSYYCRVCRKRPAKESLKFMV